MLNVQQGDQIGRIFAHCAIAYFGQCFEITEEAQIVGLLFSTVPIMYILTKNGLGNIWVTF
jgi:hypothetical protein